ncbi:hypothetical protein MYX07_03305 [Patescibacteria group bacterium AH-259-L07]|nr:hypothetical protein [Patescibacteria group bacterium AH-259-L07]
MNKEKFRLSNISALLIAVMVIGVGLVYFAQSSSASGTSFGFEKNIHERKSADEESVAGCMQSCEDMLAGWLEMNSDSKNYTRQRKKIEAKAEQCLAMNTLAGFPFSEEEILLSCGLGAKCEEIPPDISIHSGACKDISWIDEVNLPQCCTEDTPRGIDCGADTEWVVGVAAFPVCYIPNS